MTLATSISGSGALIKSGDETLNLVNGSAAGREQLFRRHVCPQRPVVRGHQPHPGHGQRLRSLRRRELQRRHGPEPDRGDSDGGFQPRPGRHGLPGPLDELLRRADPQRRFRPAGRPDLHRHDLHQHLLRDLQHDPDLDRDCFLPVTTANGSGMQTYNGATLPVGADGTYRLGGSGFTYGAPYFQMLNIGTGQANMLTGNNSLLVYNGGAKLGDPTTTPVLPPSAITSAARAGGAAGLEAPLRGRRQHGQLQRPGLDLRRGGDAGWLAVPQQRLGTADTTTFPSPRAP